MKVYCRYSGIEFIIENFSNISVEGVHPMFNATTKQLLSRTTDWAAGRLNEKERRIMFLSLLNSTELVEFRVAATPNDSIVQLNMEKLIRFAGWQNALTNPAVAFPRFVISHDTRYLENFRYWMDTWFEAKKDFEDGYKSFSDIAKLRNREVALERLIKNAQKTTEDFAGLLAIWAVDASQAPANLKDYWISLFKLKGLQVYNAKTVDLEELVEHMEEYLEHGSIYANATLRHCRTLLAKNRAGLNFGLGIPDEELEKLDLKKIQESPFIMLEDEVLTYNTKLAAADAPVDEPKENSYPSRLAYLRARASWQLAQKARQYADDVLKQEEETSKNEDADSLLAEEESSIEEGEETLTEQIATEIFHHDEDQ